MTEKPTQPGALLKSFDPRPLYISSFAKPHFCSGSRYFAGTRGSFWMSHIIPCCQLRCASTIFSRVA